MAAESWTLRAPLGPGDAEILAGSTSDPGAWQELPKLGEARRSSVARLRLSTGPVIVKRYSEPAAFRLLTFAQRSRAEREARALDVVGAVLPDHAVRPLAWRDERRFGFVARSWLVTAELEHSVDLRRIKWLEGPERAAAIRPVLEHLPRLVARLHAQRVFAATLRGKNVLLQPATGRIALIDLPYARTIARFGARHRVRDLAILSLELRRFLDDAAWSGFLADYRAAAKQLGATDLDGIDEQRVARVAASEGHRTWLSARRKSLKRSFRHSRVGEWVMGHQYASSAQRAEGGRRPLGGEAD